MVVDEYIKNRLKMAVEDFPFVREIAISDCNSLIYVVVDISTELLLTDEDWVSAHRSLECGEILDTAESWKVIYLDGISVLGTTSGMTVVYKRDYFKYDEYISFINNNLYNSDLDRLRYCESIVTLCNCLESIAKFVWLSMGKSIDNLTFEDLVMYGDVHTPELINKYLFYLGNVYRVVLEDDCCYVNKLLDLNKETIIELYREMKQYCKNCMEYVLRRTVDNEG